MEAKDYFKIVSLLSCVLISAIICKERQKKYIYVQKTSQKLQKKLLEKNILSNLIYKFRNTIQINWLSLLATKGLHINRLKN